MAAPLSLTLKVDEDDEEGEFFEIFDSYVQPDSKVSVEETACKIDELAMEAEDEGFTESFLQQFWMDLFHIASMIPSEHSGQDKLVDLILTLLKLPKRHKDPRVWKDLPYIEWEVRHIDSICLPTENCHGSEIQGHWANWNAFKARVWLSGVRDGWIVYLRNAALEFERSSVEGHSIRAFAEWLKIVGNWVLEKSRSETSTDDSHEELPVHRELGKFEGPNGWSRQRWLFWKQRFRDLPGEYDEEVKKAASEAADYMDKLEKEEEEV